MTTSSTPPFFNRIASIWHIILVPLLMCATLLLLSLESHAEGSIDLIKYPGKRLFLCTDYDQQMKIYAKEGEFINVGASHIGIRGGFVEVFNPSGVKVGVIDGNSGSNGIIFNDTQEKAGPTGGGTKNGAGYIPAVFQVKAGEEGVWSFNFNFPGYEMFEFKNLENKDAWTRKKDQPEIMRVILAWDITVSQKGAGNTNGSTLLKGRLYSNELYTAVNENGNLVSPVFYVLTKDGYIYELNFMDVDPWGFPLAFNSVGIIDAKGKPTYKSSRAESYTRIDNLSNLSDGNLYYLNPQIQDIGNIVNHKIFLNPPADDLPFGAKVTEIFKNNKHTTWLKSKIAVDSWIRDLDMVPSKEALATGKYCLGKNVLVPGKGVYFRFNTNVIGKVVLQLDLNGNGTYDDFVDVSLEKTLNGGRDSIYWDGKFANGVIPPFTSNFELKFQIKINGGEIHMMLYDIENNTGGITFKRLNGLNAPDKNLYFDHSAVGGPISGGGTPGHAKPTDMAYQYSGDWGNWKILDNWSYFENSRVPTTRLSIAIVPDCAFIPGVDSDNDKVFDLVDLDDDNDGIADKQEFCPLSAGGFSCLPGAKDPSKDEDNDGIPNYLDANDPAFDNNCADVDNDGKCDRINPIYDADGDNVPNHLDLDSDNDGITDLTEANHNQPDADANGIIDGDYQQFGFNGLYDPIDSDPNSISSTSKTNPADADKDEYPDFLDLDADNDAANDLVEAGYSQDLDGGNTGRFDIGNSDLNNTRGLAAYIAPINSGKGIDKPIDTDKDGYPDYLDLDSDNDGINDVIEVNRISEYLDADNNGKLGIGKPEVNTAGQPVYKDPNNNILSSISLVFDSDNDAIPDFRDLDADGDNLFDTYESDKPDANNDGVLGVNAVIDAFGRPTPLSASAALTDTDNDRKPDFRDTDSDNDGLLDIFECNSMPCIDLDKDGKPAFRDTDRDGDGISDTYECNSNGNNCTDTDGDGIADADDLDSDNDLLPDFYECGQFSSCPDTDQDGTPDFRDLDSDNDSLPDLTECNGATCGDLDKDGLPNFRDTDRDGDGIDDQYECSTKGVQCEDTDKDGIPDIDDLDSDNDKLPDVYECGAKNNCPDTDGDGTPDFRDLDSDGDSLPDETECAGALCGDLDKDGLPNYRDIDRDGDGIDDQYECSTKGISCEDTDKDGIADVDDLDSDNDGLPDSYECGRRSACPDWDNDGIPDFRDSDTDGDGKFDKDECPTGAPCADLDNDGNPNFRDVTCDKLLAQPVIITNSPVCNGTIQMSVNQDYINLEKIIWRNGVGDTLQQTTKQISLTTTHVDAVPPFTVKVVDQDGCSSAFAIPVDIKINNIGVNGMLKANNDAVYTSTGKEIKFNILSNDVTSTPLKWNVSIVKTAEHGKIELIDGLCTYTPDAKFEGEDLITYKLCYDDCADICSEATVKIKMEKQDIALDECHFPNILTPNGDGANDVLRLSCAANFPNSELVVYNRWGYIVHQENSYQNNWGGTFKGELLPAGTYYYIFRSEVGNPSGRIGYLTIIRD